MAFTYTLTSNPGNLFNISGSQLRVNVGSIVAGSYPITIQADNGLGTIISRKMVVTALPASTARALKFNLAQNSQYIGTLIGGV